MSDPRDKTAPEAIVSQDEQTPRVFDESSGVASVLDGSERRCKVIHIDMSWEPKNARRRP